MSSPALVIAGTYRGVGKTTISIALMAALRRRGLRVQRGHELRYPVIDEMPEHIGRRYRVSTMAGEGQEGFTVGAVLAGDLGTYQVRDDRPQNRWAEKLTGPRALANQCC
jgi:Mrp family chromosome partitioning ATPase